MRADFAQFYGLNIDDVWSGSVEPGHALILSEQLKLIPESRVRAEWLGSMTYLGWTPLTYVLANLWDLVQSALYSMAGKKMPSDSAYPRPTAPVKVEPVAISDFSVDAFMRQL